MKNTILLQLNDLDCMACVVSIDGVLDDTDGVFEVRTSYSKQVTEVTFDPQKISEKKIIKLIKEVGYDAQIVKN